MKDSASPEKRFSHSESLIGIHRKGFNTEGSYAFSVCIARAQQLIKHSNRPHFSAQKSEFQNLAKLLLRTAVLNISSRFTDSILGSIRTQLPNDFHNSAITDRIRHNFEQALLKSRSNENRPELVPLHTHNHQSYFSVSGLDDPDSVSLTYYNLGYGMPNIPNYTSETSSLGISKGPLMALKFRVPSEDWDNFLTQASLLVSKDPRNTDPFNNFARYLESLPLDIQSRTSTQFREQKSGNCTFKGISAFLKDNCTDYPRYRRDERADFKKQVTWRQRRRLGQQKFNAINRAIVMNTADILTPIPGCSIDESQDSQRALQPLRHPKWKPNLQKYLVAYYIDRLRSGRNSDQHHAEISTELGIRIEDLSESSIHRQISIRCANPDLLGYTLNIVPVPLRILFKNPRAAVETVNRHSPRTSPHFKTIGR